MNKIICIGELSLGMVLTDNGQPVASVPGGLIASAAVLLAKDSFNVTMASEAAADPVGDIAVATLQASGVDTAAVDRFTEGRTPVNILTLNADGTPYAITRYEQYPGECFDIVWPRVDEDDIVLFGGYYALDPRMRTRLRQFLTHVQERKAILVYMPGFMPQLEPRITRVMPQILENLEMAHIVVARDTDINLIFGTTSADRCYHDHIDFYCRSLVAVDTECHRIVYYSGNQASDVDVPTVGTELWNPGIVAGTVAAIALARYRTDTFDNPDETVRLDILTHAAAAAETTAKTIQYPILTQF